LSGGDIDKAIELSEDVYAKILVYFDGNDHNDLIYEPSAFLTSSYF